MSRQVDTPAAHRIVRRQVRQADKALDRSAVGDEDIHDARRHIKKARAALRLLRCSLSKSQFEGEDTLLREAAHPLGQLRDDWVLLQSLKTVVQKYRGATPLSGTRTLRSRLARNLARDRARFLDGSGGLKHARRALHRAQWGARQLPKLHGPDKLFEGLRHAYDQGRAALKQSKQTPDPEHLHLLRKQAKYLANQLKAFASAHGTAITRSASAFSKLSEQLGDHHDLTILSERIAHCAQVFPDGQSQIRLVALIDQQRVGLEHRALLLADRLYRPGGKQFAGRVRHAARAT